MRDAGLELPVALPLLTSLGEPWHAHPTHNPLTRCFAQLVSCSFPTHNHTAPRVRYDDYLESLGGDDDDEAAVEAHGARALSFFIDHAKRDAEHAKRNSAAADDDDDDAKNAPNSRGDDAPSLPPMLFAAQQLARRLERRRSASARNRSMRRDAMELLRRTEDDFHEGLSCDDARRLEKRLREFSRLAATAADEENGALADDEGGEGDDIDARLVEVKQEVAALRRTMVAALSDLKQAVAEGRK